MTDFFHPTTMMKMMIIIYGENTQNIRIINLSMSYSLILFRYVNKFPLINCKASSPSPILCILMARPGGNALLLIGDQSQQPTSPPTCSFFFTRTRFVTLKGHELRRSDDLDPAT